jgi:Predicted pPIWI-associating nuclease
VSTECAGTLAAPVARDEDVSERREGPPSCFISAKKCDASRPKRFQLWWLRIGRFRGYTLNMPDESLVKRLEARLQHDFSRDLLRGALAALTQKNVATRAQHFSVSMRDLSDHMLKQLAPDDEAVKACAWYEQHPHVQGPTRRQRALYASRGGLRDSFLKDGLKLDPKEFHEEIGPAFKELNKRTHLEPGTIITDPAELETLANETIGALFEIFDVTEDVRAEIIKRIGEHLYDEAIGVFINETIDSLDIIAGRYETGGVLYDEMRVASIDADTIRYEITGSVDVSLHYGSGSDAATIEEDFPFTCTTAASTAEPLKLLSDQTEMKVDTSSWQGEPDDDEAS